MEAVHSAYRPHDPGGARGEKKTMMHEGVLLESKSLRDSVAGRTETLDKVKALSLLPDGTHVTTQMVANYFEVGIEAIRSLVKDNRGELVANGYHVLTGAELRSFQDLGSLDKHVGRHLALFTRRTVLNVAMLLRDSIVARQVRTRLLDVEQDARLSQHSAPVDNSVFHRLAEWLDARVTEAVARHAPGVVGEETVRLTEDTFRTLLGTTVLPLLNHAVAADTEQRRELARLRERIARLERVQRDHDATGSMAALDAMSARQFEEHVAWLCRRDRCEQVSVTGGKGDLGADIVGLTADGRRLVVQCKARNPVSSVTSGTVQQFIGMAKLEYRADVALLVATAPFTRDALLLASRHDVTAVHRGLLEAWNNGTPLRALG
jgi:restriction system protein